MGHDPKITFHSGASSILVAVHNYLGERCASIGAPDFKTEELQDFLNGRDLRVLGLTDFGSLDKTSGAKEVVISVICVLVQAELDRREAVERRESEERNRLRANCGSTFADIIGGIPYAPSQEQLGRLFRSGLDKRVAAYQTCFLQGYYRSTLDDGEPNLSILGVVPNSARLTVEEKNLLARIVSEITKAVAEELQTRGARLPSKG